MSCLSGAYLTDSWRRHGDPLCDEVVRELHLGPGQDGLQAILEHLKRPLEQQAQCVQKLWAQVSLLRPAWQAHEQISREPPEGITALDQDKTAIPAIASCNRRPAPTVAEGQAVFWRYSSQIFSALLHFSLAGGFSADKVVGVLRETSYLTGEDRDKTYRRLLETTQAITDYMVGGRVKGGADFQNDLTPVTGQGWKSAVRVRLLHSSVRVRLEDRRGVYNVYDNEQDGVPINQE